MHYSFIVQLTTLNVSLK